MSAAEFEGHEGKVNSEAFNGSGKLMASGSNDGTVRLWNTQTKMCVAVLKGHTNGVKSVTFSPDGQQLASGSYDCTVRLWDTNTRECVAVLKDHMNWVFSVAFSPDGRLLASASYQTVQLWDMTQRRAATPAHVLQGHTHTHTHTLGAQRVVFARRAAAGLGLR
jgi:WD40 repeat protein